MEREHDPGAAGGGGFSLLFNKPSYQNGVVPGRQRGEPDVAYSAGINRGVIVYWDALYAGQPAGYYIFGGTSAGAPQWAGLIALGAQSARRPLGRINDTIYTIIRLIPAAQDVYFHDITVGNNAYTFRSGTTTTTIPGFAATPGWDAATGFGTPKADRLVPLLALARRLSPFALKQAVAKDVRSAHAPGKR